jgi:acyl-coenzyme A synthetase/AMP-(fatty) acid ligase
VPSQILPWISKYGIHIFPSVPGVLRILTQLPGQKSLKPLRTVISAGAPLSAEIASAFFHRFGLKIHNFYGSSETGGICYDSTGTASLTGRSVGKPLLGVKVTLSASSQIRVKSSAVALPRSSHLLPDLGEWNRYGELALLARAQAVANIGGRKVAPAEIEKILRGLAKVSEVWVSVIHLKGRDYLAAAVESTETAAILQEKLHHQLPPWKIPRFLKVKPLLPRTPRGKLDRTALRSLFPA